MALETNGISITFQSGLVAELLEYDHSGVAREAIATSHMGTTGGMTFTPSIIYDPGEISCEWAFDPEIDPVTAITAAAETVTITFPDDAPASTLACSGFLREWSLRGPFQDRMTVTGIIKLSGDLTHG